MKRLLLVTVIAAFIAAPAMADLYTVDFGTTNVKSHASITLNEWGQDEPASSGGNWGGFGSGNDNRYAGVPPTSDHELRTTWGDSTATDAQDWAEITYPTPIDWVRIRHLDGSQIDSFDVIVDGVTWGSYTGVNGSELWNSTCYTGTPGFTLRIDLTTPSATWNPTWGQLGIDRVEAVPVPGAVLLGILGLSAVGVKLRKYA